MGEKGKYGKEPTRYDRLSAAMLAQELLSDKPNAAIMLDEMDDLFPAQTSLASIFGGASNDDDNKEPSGSSKVFMNRLLENNKTITLWAANSPERFDPAFRRRILFSIRFHVPPAQVRENIWDSVTLRHNFSISAEDRRELASRFVVPPGLMDNAIRHAAITGGGMDSIKGSLRAASGLMFGNSRAIDARHELPTHYDLRFLNTRVEASEYDLATLGENIKASGKRKFSMLLYGLVGTGKTEYLSYLAKHLNMDVMIKTAASLGSKYWHETEKLIAAAFAEAEERGMFLVIDEGDTFIRNRTQLEQNHEVSVVNTMLTCMQRHTQPFGFTTNLMDNIDPAAKRRFLFKVAFDALRPEQVRDAFTHFFGQEPPNSLKGTPGLVPSDFVNVRDQAQFLSGEVTGDRLVRLLTLEAKSRMEQSSGYDGSDKGFFTGMAPR